MKYNLEQAQKYMKEALKEAAHAYALGEVPIGCVIVKDDQIIGRSFNYREHSQSALDHAEVRAIEDANHYLNSWRLNDTALFVTLEPCLMCTGAIVNARIPEVYYGAADTKAGMAGTLANLLNDRRLNHRAEIQKGILQTESLELLQKFFNNVRNKG